MKRSKKRAPEQQTMFVEAQDELLEAAPPVAQAVANRRRLKRSSLFLKGIS